MKAVYNNLLPATGTHIAGICKVWIAPKEWLVNRLYKIFSTNTITTTIVLQPGKQFIELNLLPDKYEFEELPKIGKQGEYFDISLQGLLNNIAAGTQQALITYRYHEFIVVFKDRRGRYRIAGNDDTGMQFQYSNKETSNGGGKQTVPISLAYQSEFAVPFCSWPIIKLTTPYLVVSNFTFNSITTTWNAINGTTLYYLERADDADFTTNVTVIYIGPALTYTDNNLPLNTIFYYRLKATSNDFITSNYSIASSTTADSQIFDDTFDLTFN